MQGGRPADHVQVAVRHRVERTRAHHSRHAASLLKRPARRVKRRPRRGGPRLLRLTRLRLRTVPAVPEGGLTVPARLSSGVAGGPFKRPGPGGALHHDECTAAEPALDGGTAEAGKHVGHRRLGHRVRRVGEHEVKPVVRGTSEYSLDPFLADPCAREPHRRDVRPDDLHRPGIRLDKQHARRTAREGLKPDRARSRVQVEQRAGRPASRIPTRPCRTGPPARGRLSAGCPARRHAQRAPSRLPRDDPCHVPQCVSSSYATRGRLRAPVGMDAPDGRHGLVEELGAAVAEEVVDRLLERLVGGQRRVGGHQGGRLLAGRGDQVLVGEQAQQLEAAAAACLGRAEHVALAALLQVEPGELEAVAGLRHGVKPLTRRAVRRGLGHQQAQARVAAPAHPAAQLVELGDAEPLGVHDHHGGRVGHVDADLDHRG